MTGLKLPFFEVNEEITDVVHIILNFSISISTIDFKLYTIYDSDDNTLIKGTFYPLFKN